MSAAPSPFTFDFSPRTRLVHGPDALDQVGSLAREVGGTRALLVTDAGIVAAGHAARAMRLLEAAGLSVAVYDGVRENPTTLDVARCVDAARAAKADFFLGLGGGSSMDTAKGANFILTNGGEMRDYWGVGKATKPMLPLIAVPTTAGTGSECQSAALIADETTHQKMACLDPKAAARIAVLDPLLTLSQPHRVTACTGVDALAHALETAVTKKRTSVSSAFSREALRLCLDALPRVLAEPANVEARAAMQVGAALAGLAIECSMLGAAHSAANPLTAHHHVVHGQAVGIMLPPVMEFNAADPATRAIYDAHAHAAGLRGFDALLARVREVIGQSGLAAPLHTFGVEEKNIPQLAEDAARQWTANFNPRPITAPDFERLYASAL